MKKITETVSIILPVYNGEKSLCNAIDSVINQTYSNWELIIINDGSTDHTKQIISQYTEKYNNIYDYHVDNGGVSAARNIGLNKSSGDYVCFLDADDVFLDNYLREQIIQLKKDTADFSYCSYLVDDGITIKKPNVKFYSDKFFDMYLLGIARVQTSCFMINREIIFNNKIIFNEALAWGEDITFFLECAKKSQKVTYINKRLLKYNANHDENSLSHFELNKIDQTIDFLVPLISNDKLNLNETQKSYINNYRLPAHLIYDMRRALSNGYTAEEVFPFYMKYEAYINRPIINKVGLRKLKLLYNRKKLKSSLRALM